MGTIFASCGHEETEERPAKLLWWKSAGREGPEWAYGSLCVECAKMLKAQVSEPTSEEMSALSANCQQIVPSRELPAIYRTVAKVLRDTDIPLRTKTTIMKALCRELKTNDARFNEEQFCMACWGEEW